MSYYGHVRTMADGFPNHFPPKTQQLYYFTRGISNVFFFRVIACDQYPVTADTILRLFFSPHLSALREFRFSALM